MSISFDVFVLIRSYVYSMYTLICNIYLFVYLSPPHPQDLRLQGLEFSGSEFAGKQFPDSPCFQLLDGLEVWKLGGNGTHLESWFLQIWKVGLYKVYNSGHIHTQKTVSVIV